jgi:hypothetical protein
MIFTGGRRIIESDIHFSTLIIRSLNEWQAKSLIGSDLILAWLTVIRKFSEMFVRCPLYLSHGPCHHRKMVSLEPSFIMHNHRVSTDSR